MKDSREEHSRLLSTLVRAPLDDVDSLDLRGIVWLEHVNLLVGCRAHADAFLVDFVGFAPDAVKANHFNLGRQQLHVDLSRGDFDQRLPVPRIPDPYH